MDIVDGLRAVAGAPSSDFDCVTNHKPRMREAADLIEQYRRFEAFVIGEGIWQKWKPLDDTIARLRAENADLRDTNDSLREIVDAHRKTYEAMDMECARLHAEMGNLYARIFRDGGQTAQRLGNGAAEEADRLVATLHAERDSQAERIAELEARNAHLYEVLEAIMDEVEIGAAQVMARVALGGGGQ